MNLIDKKACVFIRHSAYDREHPSLSRFFIFFFRYLTLVGLAAMNMKKKLDSESEGHPICIFAYSSTSRFTDTIERIQQLLDCNLVHGWMILMIEAAPFFPN
jgi:hypothetical protein